MTFRFFTEADLADKAERARLAEEQSERDELRFMFARWLEDREPRRGAFRVPRLSRETEDRLLALVRDMEDKPPM